MNKKTSQRQRNKKTLDTKQAGPLALGPQPSVLSPKSSVLSPKSSDFSPLSSGICHLSSDPGFTLIELIMVITILGVLAVTAAVKWPTGMENEAAVHEFKHAFRYAQHQALTREFTASTTAWGIFIAGNRYTIQRKGDPASQIDQYTNRFLLDKNTINLTGPDIGFNGLGEPLDPTAGTLLTDGDPRTYDIDGAKLTVCSETGFIKEGASCP